MNRTWELPSLLISTRTPVLLTGSLHSGTPFKQKACYHTEVTQYLLEGESYYPKQFLLFSISLFLGYMRESLFVTHGACLCLTINSTLSDRSKAKEAKIFLWIPRNLNK